MHLKKKTKQILLVEFKYSAIEFVIWHLLSVCKQLVLKKLRKNKVIIQILNKN